MLLTEKNEIEYFFIVVVVVAVVDDNKSFKENNLNK